MEAVHLGDLIKIIVGHDNSQQGNPTLVLLESFAKRAVCIPSERQCCTKIFITAQYLVYVPLRVDFLKQVLLFTQALMGTCEDCKPNNCLLFSVVSEYLIVSDDEVE